MNLPFVPFRPDRLQNLRWSFPSQYGFARDLLFVPLIPTELLRVAREYPIGLHRTAEGCEVVAYLGDAEAHTNRFVDAQGAWRGGYVPFWLRVRPFTREQGDTGILLDPGLVGVAGTYAFTEDGRTLSAEAEDVARQLNRVQRGTAALSAAAALLLEREIAQISSGAPRAGLAFVPASRPAEVLSTDIATWYARDPRAVELAVAASFSTTFLPVAAETPVTLDTAHAPAVIVPHQTGVAPLYVPTAVPADLDWLDTGEKIAF
ncbi:SapC family protein [Methylobacterium sp. SyP6R]|uniref:SapC family protein n=1 Tax=Methylobacterium sp. SyP6R TaxID=2718876 RepID=UPI001F2E7FF0|nr:SapC family protein [Methylobacterium sp. SyP6R]MCF4130230.1 SapC family protein [Methylobacterium sp. SyP6R]